MKRLTVAGRLGLLSTTLIVLMAAMSGLGLMGMNQSAQALETVYADRMAPAVRVATPLVPAKPAGWHGVERRLGERPRNVVRPRFGAAPAPQESEPRVAAGGWQSF